jgi:hypothetical protein
MAHIKFVKAVNYLLSSKDPMLIFILPVKVSPCSQTQHMVGPTNLIASAAVISSLCSFIGSIDDIFRIPARMSLSHWQEIKP